MLESIVIACPSIKIFTVASFSSVLYQLVTIPLYFILHFWVGSLCGVLDDRISKTAFPRGVIAGTDIIGLIQDLGNQIPDKSSDNHEFTKRMH